jgi:hypothetical protein
MNDADLTRQLKARAVELGFDRVGVAAARTPSGYCADLGSIMRPR